MSSSGTNALPVWLPEGTQPSAIGPAFHPLGGPPQHALADFLRVQGRGQADAPSVSDLSRIEARSQAEDDRLHDSEGLKWPKMGFQTLQPVASGQAPMWGPAGGSVPSASRGGGGVETKHREIGFLRESVSLFSSWKGRTDTGKEPGTDPSDSRWKGGDVGGIGGPETGGEPAFSESRWRNGVDTEQRGSGNFPGLEIGKGTENKESGVGARGALPQGVTSAGGSGPQEGGKQQPGFNSWTAFQALGVPSSWTPQTFDTPLGRVSSVQAPKRIRLFGKWLEPSTEVFTEPGQHGRPPILTRFPQGGGVMEGAEVEQSKPAGQVGRRPTRAGGVQQLQLLKSTGGLSGFFSPQAGWRSGSAEGEGPVQEAKAADESTEGPGLSWPGVVQPRGDAERSRHRETSGLEVHPLLSGAAAASNRSEEDLVAAQAAHELMTLAFAQRSQDETQSGHLKLGLSKLPLPGQPSHAPSMPEQEVHEDGSCIVLPVPEPSPDLVSDDDQPLALRQAGSASPGKAHKDPQPQRPPSDGEAGRPERGPPGNGVAPKEEEELATEDRCNYHSGKAKMGWRCKQPKLKGFKICKFHRKQRLDRRQASSTAPTPAKLSLKTSPLPAQETTPPKPSPIPRPPKKRPHAYLDMPPEGDPSAESSPAAAEYGNHPPPRKQRTPAKLRDRTGDLGARLSKDARQKNKLQAGETGDPSQERGAKAGQEKDGGAAVGKDCEEMDSRGVGAEKERGARRSVGGSPSSAGVEFPDEERCTYRSGAQGKWRCKRHRHENFKFCHFHRESQKKYWNKKNQARRLGDKKK